MFLAPLGLGRQTIPRDLLRFVPIASASAANVWRAADFSSAVAESAEHAATAAILGAELGAFGNVKINNRKKKQIDQSPLSFRVGVPLLIFQGKGKIVRFV